MENAQALQELTQKLIGFKTTADRPNELRACADFIADYFCDTSLKIERFEKNDISSVIVTKNKKNPKVFLCGHFDVVPADDWQFAPTQKNNRLYGRGALDMKSGDAVMMQLMHDLATTDHDVGLMLTGDEESGGFDGVGALIENGYRCQVAIIPDGGEAVHRVVSKEKGILRIFLETNGQSAHGSTPWLGQSALPLLATAMQLVTDQFMPLLAHPDDHWVSTVNFGKITVGQAANQVPAHARAEGDIRYTETENPEKILERLRAVLPSNVELTTGLIAPPVNVDSRHPLMAAFAEVLKNHGRSFETVLDHGASDGRFFAACGIPVIISQPDGAGLHGPEEWVDLPSIELYYQVLRSYLDKIAKM